MIKKLLLLPLILILVIGVFAIPLYKRANDLKSKGDELVKQDKLEEALAYYKDAYNTFPLEAGLSDDISATQLRINSDLEYSQIVEQTYAEIQQAPPVESLPPVQVKAGQVFVPILMYHHIRVNPRPQDPVWVNLNVTPGQLDQQLNFLTTHNYHVITLDDLYNAINNGKTLPENPIVLSFDDGYRNFFDNAYPILKKYNMKAIEFIITGVEGTDSYLTWDQIKEMDKSGLIEFGAHTQHHPNLPDLSQMSINSEITLSKSDLENQLGKPTHWFAYPYGSYSNYIVGEVKTAGYLGAVSTIYGGVQSKDNLYLLQRIGISGAFTLDEFARRVSR